MEKEFEKLSIDILKKRNKLNIILQFILYGVALVNIVVFIITRHEWVFAMPAILIILGLIMEYRRRKIKAEIESRTQT